MTDGKISFKGIIISVQPRIRLMRSFDERSHNYLGYPGRRKYPSAHLVMLTLFSAFCRGMV